MTTTPRPQRENINTSENRRLIAADVARIVAADEAKAASRIKPEIR